MGVLILMKQAGTALDCLSATDPHISNSCYVVCATTTSFFFVARQWVDHHLTVWPTHTNQYVN